MIGTLDFFQRIQPYPYGKHIKRVDMKESGTFQGGGVVLLQPVVANLHRFYVFVCCGTLEQIEKVPMFQDKQ